MAMADSEYPYDALEYAMDHMEVPEGYRVEIIEGEIVVSPTPQGPHIKNTTLLQLSLAAAAPSGTDVVQMASIALPETGQRYIPDLLVLPDAILNEPEWLFPGSAALLVVEVTSPHNARTDRVKKLRGYARSHVPAYLLVDREPRTTTLFTEPENGAYRRDVKVPFGEKLPLPEPFSGEIDTSEFV